MNRPWMISAIAAGALSLTPWVHGDLVGVGTVGTPAPDYGGPEGYVCVELFAYCTDPGDRVNAFGSGPYEPLRFWTDDPDGILAIGPPLYSGEWHDRWDSFAAIGLNPGTGNLGDLLPGTNNWTGGFGTPTSPGWVVSNGGYYYGGGIYADEGYVHMGQITLREGYSFTLEGQLSLTLSSWEGLNEMVAFHWAVPAPSAVPLLGLAALVGRRRR